MDMNERVAARRAELGRKQREQTAAVESENKAAHEAGMSDIFDGLSGQAATDGATIRRSGDKIVLDEAPAAPPTMDIAGMRRSKVNRMLNDTARRRWTPDENIVVIGLISAALPTLALSPTAAIIMFLIGIWRFNVANEKYRRQLRVEYPELFAQTAK